MATFLLFIASFVYIPSSINLTLIELLINLGVENNLEPSYCERFLVDRKIGVIFHIEEYFFCEKITKESFLTNINLLKRTDHFSFLLKTFAT